jgi:hypothetical protein
VPNGTYYDSGSTILSGTYRAFELPLPASIGFALTGLLSLLGLRQRKMMA